VAGLAHVPRLRTAWLLARNRAALASRRNLFLVLIGIGALTLLIFIADLTAPALEWLDAHRFGAAAVCALAGAMLVARRRVHLRAQFARSWLAAVPVRPSAARRQALLIETFPAAVLIAVLLLGCAPHWLLWAYSSFGIAIGSIASYGIPAPKPADLPPGSRYVPHKRAKGSPKLRPSLKALGLWPLRQMFAWAQPKMVARATIPVFLSMPMGTMADAALVVVGLFAALGALLLLLSAVVSAGAKARRWTAPLPVRLFALLRFFLAPTLFAVAGLIGASYLLLLLLLLKP
jgi:hypothetical protein